MYNLTMSKTLTKSNIKPQYTEYTDSSTGRILTRYVIVVIAYLLLVLILPGNKDFMQVHRLSTAEYHTLQFLVGLPLIGAWFVAFYGYAKLEEYARSISASPEAVGFKLLARGSAWIAWSLPVYAILSLVRRSLSDAHPGWSNFLTITANYAELLFPVIGFTLIGMASRYFLERSKNTLSAANIRGISLFFLIGGALYCYFIFRQLTGTGLGDTDNPFHLPVWLTVLTIIVPYLYAWFVGILAVYELAIYCRGVRGVLYRQALQLLVIGLFATILGSVALQYARSTTQLSINSHLLLGTFFVFSVIFQIISGIGFALMALGAIRLKKIEEV